MLIRTIFILVCVVYGAKANANNDLFGQPNLFGERISLNAFPTPGKVRDRQDDIPNVNKKYGIDINPIRMFLWMNGGEEDSFHLRAISGGFSYFDHERKVEIAIPVYFGSRTELFDGLSPLYYDINGSSNRTLYTSALNIDVHYRKYLGNYIDGFYVSSFVRVSRLEGTELNDGYTFSGRPIKIVGKDIAATRVGVGAGLGFRIMPSRGFYFGIGLIGGVYITESIGKLYNELPEADRYIVDFELLKFGYAF